LKRAWGLNGGKAQQAGALKWETPSQEQRKNPEGESNAACKG